MLARLVELKNSAAPVIAIGRFVAAGLWVFPFMAVLLLTLTADWSGDS